MTAVERQLIDFGKKCVIIYAYMPQQQGKTAKQRVTLSFRPTKVVDRLLREVPERVRDVLTRRFGLGKDEERQTLEAIGKRYGITRERVRQIELYGLSLIRKSAVYREMGPVFEELTRAVDALGGVVPHEDLFSFLASHRSSENALFFLMTVGDEFFHAKETPEFRAHWFLDPRLSQKVQEALRNLYHELPDDALVPEHEMIDRFLRHLQGVNDRYFNEEVVTRWLFIAKKLGRNPLGEWGKTNAPHIRLRGIRDYAYAVLRRHGSPMHFREVARVITELFQRKAHEATTHNELIKDPRFVLVGRGVYALREWGYEEGAVKDIIERVLREHGPLPPKAIVDFVKRERYVKDATILANLHDTTRFRRLADGRYALARDVVVINQP
ncbi:hypothetical protein D6792_00060 [Candidatus Parcubacteria bacterium]|nr:MAG: hypothetical protein D6792_00060 [Candidatus Parcubacteria bacterium]GIW68920.1 MAG: hypothetical protein KatS3mg100_414 [Candidatus Parcubacteria bacterium]